MRPCRLRGKKSAVSAPLAGTVATALADAGVPYTVVDRRDREGVDVVGDATDGETLTGAGVERARTVVFAMGEEPAW